jgi:hypothetical protein
LAALGWYFRKSSAWTREIMRNSKESFAEMDEDGDLENGIGIKMD